MIVLVGSPVAHEDGRAAGLLAMLVPALVATGATVEIVGRVGEDARGELLLHDLQRVGAGHVAVFRDPTRTTPIFEEAGIPLDAEDVQLGLGYLRTIDAILVVDPAHETLLEVAAEAARFNAARLVVLMSDAESAAVLAAMPSARFTPQGSTPPVTLTYERGSEAAIVPLLCAHLLADNVSATEAQ
ncbi:MAG: hypothetical protein ACKN9R_01980 [Candidatus Limnocylindrus sp.]|jgi:hypothetical protein